ncbi:MAG: hypothetical protein IPM98_09950 [Lewinellaceae bacterium]|nr:hypothetical protein [Lewinellaceae bacterium]
MVRHAPWIFLMLSLFSCFRKKTAPETVGAWLEQQFPGRFDVQVSNLKMLDLPAQFKGEKRAAVADKADQEVQFFLNWQKGVDGLGLDVEAVTRAHEYAKTEVATARAWQERLQNAGLEKFSVGVVDKALIVQVFGEPSAAIRDGSAATIRRALNDRQDQFPERVFIEIMEPVAFHTEFRDIIPRGHWEIGTGWQRNNLILSWCMESGSDAAAVWEYNPESGRSSRYHTDAFQQAKAWADKNLRKPFFMDSDQMVAYDGAPPKARKKGPAISFSFPYFDKKPGEDAEPQGYIIGIYYPDEQVFTDVHVQRTF